MAEVTISALWFYLMYTVILILIVTIVVLGILLTKAKSKLYRQLATLPGESTVTNSNRYNMQFQNRTHIEELFRDLANFHFAEPQTTIKICSNDTSQNTNVSSSADQVDEASNKTNKKPIAPPLIMRDQIDNLCKELLRTQRITQNKENAKESYELVDVSKIKKKSIPNNGLERSMSSPELDMYDVLPSKVKPVTNFSSR